MRAAVEQSRRKANRLLREMGKSALEADASIPKKKRLYDKNLAIHPLAGAVMLSSFCFRLLYTWVKSPLYLVK